MVRCDCCDGYVSRDYARVFGDNHDCVTSCPNCQTGWDDGTEADEERSERKVTFRMSEFESDTASGSGDAPVPSDSAGSETTDGGSRFGRVGRAVSGLF
ncbi:hypothetical protein [Halalkalicoccus sp. NIPERK01]|uniref:DUF7563 family protein n=1 Tax=Halalkalicoccus sp. NIPERK01 TaxID=3053469 RepID=UPI00256EA06F|nr:hypothetical protein [Halalkalicoccus sp. NIPERK01]MDL5362771.1 hypothetical protein [Halalkalicoccus sp. NIPERK01]